MRQHQDQELAFGELQKIVQDKTTFALFDFLGLAATLAAGQELAQPAVGCAIARIDQDIRRAAGKDDARADQQSRPVFDFGIVECLVGAYDAGKRVVVGNADSGKTQRARLLHVVLRMRPAAQEREVRGDADLGIIGSAHANSPCTNQLAGAGLPSTSYSSLP